MLGEDKADRKAAEACAKLLGESVISRELRSPLNATEAAATSRDERGQLTLYTRFLMLTRVQLTDSVFR
jgi:hypothetical protein